MRFMHDNVGAEMSEVIAALVAILAAGMVAVNLAMGGLQTAATTIPTWLAGQEKFRHTCSRITPGGGILSGAAPETKSAYSGSPAQRITPGGGSFPKVRQTAGEASTGLPMASASSTLF